MDIITLVVLAFVGEAIWETFKMTWQEGKVSVDRIGAIMVCLVIAFGVQLDVFALIGLPLAVPYVGIVFTALLISRGANWVHDFMGRLGEKRVLGPPVMTVEDAPVKVEAIKGDVRTEAGKTKEYDET